MGLVDGKIVLVTGAASGIGAAAATSFSREGAAHVVVADMDSDGARKTLEGLVGPGSRVDVDVTDEAAVALMID